MIETPLKEVIYEGDHTDPRFIRPALIDAAQTLDGNWVCKQAVIDKSGTVIIEPEVITEKDADNLYFKCQLSPTDSDKLIVTRSPTEYSWAIEISNESIG